MAATAPAMKKKPKPAPLFIRVGRKKYTAWIDRDPTPEELLKQFAPAIQAQINEFNGYLSNPADREDIWQEIEIGIWMIPAPSNRGVGYVMRTIHNVAIKAVRDMVGVSRSKSPTASKRQLTDPLETANGYNPEVEKAASVSDDPMADMAMDDVKKRLT